MRTESERAWTDFEKQVRDMKRAAEDAHARFAIFVSPLLYHVDPQGLHPHYNHDRLDFSCATIDPKARLQALAASLGVPLIDPTDYLRENFNRRIREGNFAPYYLPGDANHPSATGAAEMAEYLAEKLKPILLAH